MKTLLLQWLTFGALTASAAMNVIQAKKPAEVESPCAQAKVTMAVSGHADCSLVEKLDLTPTQMKELAERCPTYARDRAQLHDRLDKLVAKLDQTLATEKPDMKRIHWLVDEIGKARTDELRSCIKNIMTVRRTLTSCQMTVLTGCCSQDD